MPSNGLYLIQNLEEDSYNSTVTSISPHFTYFTEFERPHKETRIQNIVQCLSLRNWFIHLIFPAEILLLSWEQNFPGKRFRGSCSSPADMHHRNYIQSNIYKKHKVNNTQTYTVRYICLEQRKTGFQFLVSWSLWSVCLRKYLDYFLWLYKYFLYLVCNSIYKHDIFRDLNHRWTRDESEKLETDQIRIWHPLSEASENHLTILWKKHDQIYISEK